MAHGSLPLSISDVGHDPEAEFHLGCAVWLRTEEPHKGEFLWTVFRRVDERILHSGYHREMAGAIAEAHKERIRLFRIRAHRRFE